jgi:hypothetical protein
MRESDRRLADLSASAVELLAKAAIGDMLDTFDRKLLGRVFGVSPRRLKRFASPDPAARVPLEWGLRLRSVLNLEWSEVFLPMPGLEGWRSQIRGRLASAGRFFRDAAGIREREAKVRGRLRDLVDSRGFSACSREWAVPKSTLHGYLTRKGVPLAFAWRVHLLAGTPITPLLSGRLDEDETAIREALAKDPAGRRFSGLHEPIVRYAWVRELILPAPWPGEFADALLDLFRTSGRSHPRVLRLAVPLASRLAYSGRRPEAERVMRRAAEAVEALEEPGQSLFCALHAARLGFPAQARRMRERLSAISDPAAYLPQIRLSEGIGALAGLRVSEAVPLLRESRFLRECRRADDGDRALNEFLLAVAAFAAADFDEALDRTRRMLREPAAFLAKMADIHHLRMAAFAETGRWEDALRECAKFRERSRSLPGEASAAVPELWEALLLLLRKAAGGTLAMKEESRIGRILAGRRAVAAAGGRIARTLYALCRFHGSGDEAPLRSLAAGLLSGKFFEEEPALPFEYLPRLLAALRASRAWSPRLESWAEGKVRQGCLVLGRVVVSPR